MVQRGMHTVREGRREVIPLHTHTSQIVSLFPGIFLIIWCLNLISLYQFKQDCYNAECRL